MHVLFIVTWLYTSVLGHPYVYAHRKWQTLESLANHVVANVSVFDVYNCFWFLQLSFSHREVWVKMRLKTWSRKLRSMQKLTRLERYRESGSFFFTSTASYLYLRPEKYVLGTFCGTRCSYISLIAFSFDLEPKTHELNISFDWLWFCTHAANKSCVYWMNGYSL